MSSSSAHSSSSVASAEVLAERRAAGRGRDLWAGIVVHLGLLAAVLVSVGRIWSIASGPLPPGPGEAAPAFSGQLLSGEPVRLEELRGRVVLLDFWATWCPPCVASLPGLQRLHERHGDAGLIVLGINQEPGQAPGVQSFLRGRGLDFPVLVDEGGLAASYGVHSLPTTFLIDAEGVIRASYRGRVSEEKLDRVVAGLLASDH